MFMGTGKVNSYSEKRKTFPQQAQERIGAAANEIRTELSMFRSERQLTAQEAADILNVPRPFVDQLMDEGIIPSQIVGDGRSVTEGDVMRYRQAEKQRQEDILEALAKEAQDLDLGY